MSYSSNPLLPKARAEAVRLVVEQQLPVAVAARKSGINRTTTQLLGRGVARPTRRTHTADPTRWLSGSSRPSSVALVALILLAGRDQVDVWVEPDRQEYIRGDGRRELALDEQQGCGVQPSPAQHLLDPIVQTADDVVRAQRLDAVHGHVRSRVQMPPDRSCSEAIAICDSDGRCVPLRPSRRQLGSDFLALLDRELHTVIAVDYLSCVFDYAAVPKPWIPIARFWKVFSYSWYDV